MKLTEKRLKEIILEELEAMNEVGEENPLVAKKTTAMQKAEPVPTPGKETEKAENSAANIQIQQGLKKIANKAQYEQAVKDILGLELKNPNDKKVVLYTNLMPLFQKIVQRKLFKENSSEE